MLRRRFRLMDPAPTLAQSPDRFPFASVACVFSSRNYPNWGCPRHPRKAWQHRIRSAFPQTGRIFPVWIKMVLVQGHPVVAVGHGAAVALDLVVHGRRRLRRPWLSLCCNHEPR